MKDRNLILVHNSRICLAPRHGNVSDGRLAIRPHGNLNPARFSPGCPHCVSLWLDRSSLPPADHRRDGRRPSLGPLGPLACSQEVMYRDTLCIRLSMYARDTEGVSRVSYGLLAFPGKCPSIYSVHFWTQNCPPQANFLKNFFRAASPCSMLRVIVAGLQFSVLAISALLIPKK